MTDEISIRSSRARRGADVGDSAAGNPSPHPADGAGETAWHLGDRSVTEPRPAGATREPPAAAPFPAFPGLGSAEEEEPSGPSLDVRRYLQGVWKRRWLAAGIAAGTALLATLLAFTLMAHKWEAAAVLMVRTHQDEFALGSSKPFKPQEYNLKTLLDTVKLPSSLDAVMKATDISVLRRTLAAAIDVTPGKDSNLFQVKAVWKDPRTAAAIANETAGLLVERSRSLRRKDAEEAVNYYDGQLAAAREKRRSINAEMQALQAKHKVSDFETEIKVLIEELAQRDAEYTTKVAETEAMHASRDRLDQLIGQQPDMVVLSTIYRSPLKQRLSDYEWQLQEALSRYTAENPKVIKLEKRIAVLEQMIEESNDEGAPQNTYAPNTERTEMRMRLQALTDELKVREAQVGALETMTNGMREKLAQLSAGKKEYELIRTQLGSAETLEANLVSRVDEARVIMLRNEASFDLVETARPPQEPLPSGRKLAVGGGLVLGTGAGLVIALLLEFLDPLVRRRRDVEDITGTELVWEFQRVPPGQHSVVDARAPGEPVAVLFRRLVNEMEARLDDDDWRCLGITSVEAEAGRSLVATDLAQALALKEHAVVLVDADLRAETGRRPSDLFDLRTDQPGLWEALNDGASITSLLAKTESPGLQVLGPGALPATGEDAAGGNPMALGTRQMRALVAELEQSGRRVLFDLPPLTAQETVAELASAIGNLVLVVRSGQTRRAELRESAEMLKDRGAHIRAVVMTDVPADLLSTKPTFDAPPSSRHRKGTSRRRPTPVQPTLEIHG